MTAILNGADARRIFMTYLLSVTIDTADIAVEEMCNQEKRNHDSSLVIRTTMTTLTLRITNEAGTVLTVHIWKPLGTYLKLQLPGEFSRTFSPLDDPGTEDIFAMAGI